MSDPRDYGAVEDKTLPVIAYVLYLLGLTHGLTIIIAVIMAYVARDNAGPVMRSHYTWMIRTFWLSIGFFVAGVAMIAVGVPLSFILIGIPIVMIGGVLCAATWIWVAVRIVAGLVWAAQDQPCPRPFSLTL